MAAGISNRQFRVLLTCFLRDQKLHEKQSKTSMNNHVKRIYYLVHHVKLSEKACSLLSWNCEILHFRDDNYDCIYHVPHFL
jgi:hypothetical protein